MIAKSTIHWCFPGGWDTKESACNAGDLGSIPRLGRSPGGRYGNPLQYSCLENPRRQRSLAGYIPWGRKESDMIKWLSTALYTESGGLFCHRGSVRRKKWPDLLQQQHLIRDPSNIAHPSEWALNPSQMQQEWDPFPIPRATATVSSTVRVLAGPVRDPSSNSDWTQWQPNLPQQ